MPVDKQKLPPQQSRRRSTHMTRDRLHQQPTRSPAPYSQKQITDNTLLIVNFRSRKNNLARHSLSQTQNSMYQPFMHVPLVMRFPNTCRQRTRATASLAEEHSNERARTCIAATKRTRFPFSRICAESRTPSRRDKHTAPVQQRNTCSKTFNLRQLSIPQNNTQSYNFKHQNLTSPPPLPLTNDAQAPLPMITRQQVSRMGKGN